MEIPPYPPEDEELTFERYTETALRFAVYPQGDFSYCVLGICGEAGEVAEKLKKIKRDKGGEITPDDVKAIMKELSDVLWYINAAAHELGHTLQDVAQTGVTKLTDRHRRGVLHGSGDDR